MMPGDSHESSGFTCISAYLVHPFTHVHLQRPEYSFLYIIVPMHGRRCSGCCSGARLFAGLAACAVATMSSRMAEGWDARLQGAKGCVGSVHQRHIHGGV